MCDKNDIVQNNCCLLLPAHYFPPWKKKELFIDWAGRLICQHTALCTNPDMTVFQFATFCSLFFCIGKTEKSDPCFSCLLHSTPWKSRIHSMRVNEGALLLTCWSVYANQRAYRKPMGIDWLANKPVRERGGRGIKTSHYHFLHEERLR